MSKKTVSSFNFVLKIFYPDNICTVNKSFEAKDENSARKLASQWKNNCLAICGKDDQNRQYLMSTLRLV